MLETIEHREDSHIVYSFCTLCTLLKGKRLSYQNVLLLVLQDDNYYKILSDMLSMNSKFEVVKLLLTIDPSVCSSKYISKYVNQLNRKRKRVEKE